MSLPTFKNPSLLRRALTHSSYVNEHPEALEDNERLEFLGDAVLDFVTGAFLYSRYPEMAEGHLTRMRAALVRTEQLAQFAFDLGLAELMQIGKGEAEGGGRQRISLLCATFEAMVGAYFLDAGVEAVRQYIEPLFLPAADTILLSEADMDAKSLFQEWAQAHVGGTPLYRLADTRGPDHEKEFTMEAVVGVIVYGIGTGRSKQVATQKAAQAALRHVGLV